MISCIPHICFHLFHSSLFFQETLLCSRINQEAQRVNVEKRHMQRLRCQKSFIAAPLLYKFGNELQ